MDERKTHFAREGALIKHTSIKQKRLYVDEIVRTRGASAIPLLVEMLAQDSWTLREASAAALAAMGPQVLHSVLPLARSGLWFARAAATRVLGAVGGSESVPVMLRMLSEENSTVTSAAADALTRICQRGGAASVSRRLFELESAARDAALVQIEARDLDSGARVRQLLLDRQLMTVREDEDEVWEEPAAAAGGSSGHGLVWEVLTGGKAQS